MKIDVSFVLNGFPVTARAAPFDRLLHLLRRELGLVGTREGCGQGECGACTVLVDGRPVNSCLYPAPDIEGRDVLTIEGLSTNGTLSTLQRSFVELGAIQCGFCTPGMILSAHALVEQNPEASEREIREALAGNLCRCTGYLQIVRAVRRAAEQKRVESEKK